MAAVKTYILAPNFQYKPSGAIQLGNIIADPLRPAKALSVLPAEKRPPVDSITEYNHELSGEKGRLLSAGVWSQFLQTVGGDIRAERDANTLKKYEMEELETRYLRDEPPDDDPDIALRLSEPKVRATIKAGLFRNQPVYMITGVKIARGLTVRNERSTRVGGGLGSTVPVTESVSVGGELRGERRDAKVSAFKGGKEDIVFAYQLHVIRLKGRKKKVVVGAFESEAALLHGEEVPSDLEVEGTTIGMATADELREIADDENAGIETCEVLDAGGSKCVCIVATYV
ncbi:hypothetical protein AB5N19_12411 [Seiridium cardinale]